MDYPTIKGKHGERLLSLASTDIVLAGMKALLQEPEEKSPLTAQVQECIRDINSGSWDEIRAVIKRSL